MKKVIIIIGVILALLIVVVGVVGVMLPKEYGLERSIVINASPEAIFPYVNNLEKNKEWSPWEEEDSTIKETLGEIKEGLGATSSWESENSGSGSMKIVESVPYSLIVNELDFGEMGTATGKWTFEVVENGTKTTWFFDGEATDIGSKIFGAMIGSFMGPQYEKGLKNLKAIVEKEVTETEETETTVTE